MNPDSRYIIIRKTLKIFLPFIAILIAISIYIVTVKNNSELTLFKKIEQNTANLTQEKIEKELFLVISDLSILASLNDIKTILEDLSNKRALNNLKSYFQSLSKNRRVYDQIRLLDESGMELIRVNFNNGNPNIVASTNLQNKKGRYYFDDSFQLNRNEVFVSPLDLNIEHGEIETPLKPMIRFATPIFDKSGEKKGIILLNYLGNQITQNPTKTDKNLSNNNIMIVNSDGYWLKGLSPDQEWGFMYEDKKNVSFKNSYNSEWDIIKQKEESQIETNNGLFTFRTVHPIPEGLISSSGSSDAFAPSARKISSEDYFWKIISFAPHKTFYSERQKRNKLAILIILFLVVGSFFASYKVTLTNHLREKTNKQLYESEKKLRVLNSTKDKFFSIIAHDLKTPFNSLLGFSELLDINYDKYDTEKKKRIIHMIRNGLDATNKLLKNLLSWSLSQSGNMDYKPENLNLYIISKETINLLNQAAQNKSIQLINKISENVFVHADKDMLSTIIRNLISNALKFTPIKGEIVLKAQFANNNSDSEFTEIAIQDNGVGITKEVQDKLFDIDSNTSTNGTENETGTGLGLILCKEFTEKHGGKIWVESEINKGSTFYFTIPNSNK